MRILLAAAIVLLASPFGEAKSPKSQCRDRCYVQYELCQKRSTTSKGRSACKVDLRTCRGSCGK